MDVKQTPQFSAWLEGLADRQARTRIVARLSRVQAGLLGDVKPVGAGVSEMRISYGPGYRLYFVQRGAVLIVLLCGGDKSSQPRDIARAKSLAKELD